MMQLSMESGICKYSLVSFLNYAGMLCNNKVFRNIEGGCRLGGIVMKVLSQRFGNDSDQKAKLFFHYYALIACYSEPLQNCRHMLKEGFEAGMCSGDIRYAFLNALNQIRLSLLSGENLQDLLKETEYYLSLMGKQQQNQTKALMLMFHETISLLISNSEYTAPPFATGSIIPPLQHCFHKALQSFFMSRSERCNHFSEKIMHAAEGGRQHHIFITSYYALNSFKVAETVHTKKIRAVPEQAVATFKAAAEQSKYNFQNKVELLEAELYNRNGEHDKAKASYAAAIASARSSKFIHEEGLACEKAAFHHKNVGEISDALKYFMQARECYKKWGSKVKVDDVDGQIVLIQT
jgi:tetratricopeptide (TPR) repeat protein